MLYLSSFLGKGQRQKIISYKMMPRDHISAEVLVFLPWQLRKISGARQLKVPKILFSQPDSLEMLEICEHPKSQILQQVPSSLAQRMFQGLRSRCIILRFYSSRKADVIWMMKVSNFYSSKTVLSSICFLNDPLHSSITMFKKNYSSSQSDSMILITLSLSISSNLLTSTLTSSRYGFWTQICLTAQCSLFQLLTISWTEAKVPSPSLPKSVYFLSWISLNTDLLIYSYQIYMYMYRMHDNMLDYHFQNYSLYSILQRTVVISSSQIGRWRGSTSRSYLGRMSSLQLSYEVDSFWYCLDLVTGAQLGGQRGTMLIEQQMLHWM